MQDKKRPITVIVSDGRCHRRWVAILAGVFIVGLALPSPVDLVKHHSVACQFVSIC